MQNYRFMDPQRGEIPFTPQLLQQVMAQAFPGNQWYVNESTGSDSYDGSFSHPFATLAAAHAAAADGNGDVVLLNGTAHCSSTLAWSKNALSLVALRAPSNNGRSRISSSGSVFTPMVNVTGEGCSFIGIGTFYGFNSDTAQVCWADNGGRNYYKRMQFLGGGNATAAANAGMRSLTVGGDGENLFEDCTIGLDTVLRATGNNASLEFLNSCQRNIFRRTLFQAYSSNAANVHIKVGTDGVDRTTVFEDTTMVNNINVGSGIAMNAAVSMAADAGGNLLFSGMLSSLGATAIATAGNVYIMASAIGANTTGIAIKAT